MVAVWSVVTVPAVSAKVAVVDPDGTVTEVGTVALPRLLESVTMTPVPAALESVTVHVLVAPPLNTAGEQETKLRAVGLTRDIEAVWLLPLYAAVIVAVVSAAIVWAVATKATLLLPEGTVTEAGTFRLPVLLVSATLKAAGATRERVTVQMAPAPELRVGGEQVSRLTTVAVIREIDAACEVPLYVAVMMAD